MQKPLLGKYNVLKTLGSGLGSKVFLTEHGGERFVVKLLTSSLTIDTRIQEEVFNREVNALLKLQSPLVPKLIEYGFDKSHNAFFLVTEYIEGDSLSSLLEREGSLSALRSIEICAEVLAVLDFYHSKGLVHRDVKPSNIIISKDQIVRLVDFGIAKDFTNASKLTLVNTNLGTPEYISPEIANNEETDHRSDFFSLGVVLYECLAGKTPFKSKSPMHTLLLVLTSNPPKLPYREDVPPELEQVINKALAKNREKRYQSADEFLEDLKKCYDIIKSGYKRQLETETKEDFQKQPIKKRKPTTPLIYCLDDQIFILNILKHILGSHGFEVFTFSTWDDLHKAMDEDIPDLVITDVQMPEVNGVRVCQLLKQAYPSLKVILFSNVYEDELANLSIQAGANAWISKSWTPDVWLSKICEILSKEF